MVQIETEDDGELSEGEIPDHNNNHRNHEGTNKQKDDFTVSRQTYDQFKKDQSKIKTKLCKFFVKGNCTKGTNCTFIHDNTKCLPKSDNKDIIIRNLRAENASIRNINECLYQENENLSDRVKNLTSIKNNLTDCLINRFNFDIRELNESECKDSEPETESKVREQQAPGGSKIQSFVVNTKTNQKWGGNFKSHDSVLEDIRARDAKRKREEARMSRLLRSKPYDR